MELLPWKPFASVDDEVFRLGSSKLVDICWPEKPCTLFIAEKGFNFLGSGKLLCMGTYVYS